MIENSGNISGCVPAVQPLSPLQRLFAMITSLGASVVFYTNAGPLAMYDSQGNERWFCQEVWTDRLEDGRGTHSIRIWDDTGRYIASTAQNCIVKLKPDEAVPNKGKWSISKM